MSEKILSRTIATKEVEWPLFIELLAKRLGDPDDPRCRHDHRHAKAALSVLGFDVESSLAFFKEHGGFCDCEIMLNIYAADA